MSSSKVDPPFAVRVPAPGDDRPSWIKVGVIAAVGFAVGIVWPRVAGLKLGPSAPDTSHSQVAAAPASASATAAPRTPAALTASAPAASVVPPAPAAPVANVTFGHGYVASCKTNEGETHKGASHCGAVAAFDSLAQPRLKKVAECPAAAGAAGKLAVLFTVDFEGNRVGIDLGKATTIGTPDALLACVKTAFQGVTLAGVEHQHARYNVLYTLAITPIPGAAASSTPAQGADEAGTVQVVWPVAIVRDTPKTGQVIARLHRGTKVKIGAPKEGWYTIKYGQDFGHEGWVYREAIGK